MHARPQLVYTEISQLQYSGTPWIRTLKCGHHGVRIIRVSVLSEFSGIKSRTRVLSINWLRQTFFGNENVNYIWALISLNHGNLIAIYHTVGEICISNRAEILTALKHCLVSSVTVTVTSLRMELWKPFDNLLTQYSRTYITLLLLLFLILSVKRGWRCIRVCHWRHGKVSVA